MRQAAERKFGRCQDAGFPFAGIEEYGRKPEAGKVSTNKEDRRKIVLIK
ncbi:MAG: hypothetical protein HF314_16100 [Ignavibacteria bacterium]|nr:hypothetical protein [Ignavibacteria bacterium]MCU7504604.1 hypothetical protein [Ignavibacteria bacterium]MCU7517980.1 hypothetical protein [Ignavibacteria bacterium]